MAIKQKEMCAKVKDFQPTLFFKTISVGSDQYDKLSDQGYTSLPKSDKIESGQMVLK